MAGDIKLDITDKDTLDILVEKVEATIRNALDKHIPLQTKSVVDRHKVPWFTEEVRDGKKWMRCRKKLWRKHSTEDLWTAFKVVRQQYKNLHQESKIRNTQLQDTRLKGDTRNYTHLCIT